ncbi:spore germination protein, partial [Paenibacillus riograndensis]
MPGNPPRANRSKSDNPEQSAPAPFPLDPSLEVNLQELGQRIGHSSDIVVRRFTNESLGPLELALIYIDGLVNADVVNQAVLQPLLETVKLNSELISAADAFHVIKNQMLPIGGVKEGNTLEALLPMLFDGYTLILLGGLQAGMAADTSGWEKRGINEPTSQGVIRGPKEGFTESLRTGTSMLRRRLKTPDLRIEEYKIGQRTQTGVALVYLEGIASEQVLEEIRRRLKAINTDSILESNYIEEFIQDGGLTPFPTIQN